MEGEVPSSCLGNLVRHFSASEEAYSLRKMQDRDGVPASVGQSLV